VVAERSGMLNGSREVAGGSLTTVVKEGGQNQREPRPKQSDDPGNA